MKATKKYLLSGNAVARRIRTRIRMAVDRSRRASSTFEPAANAIEPAAEPFSTLDDDQAASARRYLAEGMESLNRASVNVSGMSTPLPRDAITHAIRHVGQAFAEIEFASSRSAD